MKFIDDNGRLFGKVNIIDFMVILFLLCLIPMFYFGYKISNRKPIAIEQKKDFVEIEINCNLIKVSPEISSLIRVGDKGLGMEGEQTGEITSIEKSSPWVYRFYIDNTSSSSPLVITDPRLKDVFVKIKLKAEIRDNNLYYNDKRIMDGSAFVFKTGKYKVEAVPAPVIMERWIEVEVRFKGVFPELSMLIDNGHMETDEKGRTVGLLKEVKDRQPAQLQVFSSKDDKLVQVTDPHFYDIVALLDLLVSDKNGGAFYKSYPIKVGGQITFTSNLYTVSGLVTNIKEIGKRRSN